jgi:hypothetical protein
MSRKAIATLEMAGRIIVAGSLLVAGTVPAGRANLLLHCEKARLAAPSGVALQTNW